jgi:hypothetical protein
MSDLEIIGLNLTAEFMSINCEKSLFKQINSYEIRNLIDCSQFNKKSRIFFYIHKK